MSFLSAAAEVVRPEPTQLDNILTLSLVGLLVLVVLVVVIRRATKKDAAPAIEEEAPAAPPAPPEPSAEEKLLTEIRDLLRDQK